MFIIVDDLGPFLGKTMVCFPEKKLLNDYFCIKIDTF
jgi:hypothetical protein